MKTIKDIIKIDPENRVLFYPGAGTDFETIRKVTEYHSAFKTFIFCDFDAYELRQSNPDLPNPGFEPDLSFLDNKMGLQGFAIKRKEEFTIRDAQYTECQLALADKYGCYQQYITETINIVSYQVNDGIQIYYFKAEALALKNVFLTIFSDLNSMFTVYLQAFTGGGFIPQSTMYSMTGPLLEGWNGEYPVMVYRYELDYFRNCNVYSASTVWYEEFEEYGYIFFRDKGSQLFFNVLRALTYT